MFVVPQSFIESSRNKNRFENTNQSAMSVQIPVSIVTSPAITNSFFQDSSKYKCNGYSSPQEVPINQHVLNVTDGPLRKRSESTGDTIERLSLMDIDQDETVLDRPARALSPPIRSETICIPQNHSRSHSLTPEPTMSRTPNPSRHLFRRGKTIDTSSITKEEHEVCVCVCMYIRVSLCTYYYDTS